MDIPTVFYSNRTEILFQKLKENLFSKCGLFTKRIVVVSNPLMKSWLYWQLAQDPDLQIACGIEIIFLQQAYEKIENLLIKEGAAKKRSCLPSTLNLTFSIESALRRKIQEWPHLSEKDERIWHPFINSLGIFKTNLLSKGTENRLISISQQLAALFQKYAVFAGDMVNSWKEPKGWQEDLWRTLFLQENGFDYLAKEVESFVKRPLETAQNVHIHLFALGTIPPLYYRFLVAVSSAVPTCFYILSPCQRFWSDIKSDRERQSVKRYWEKKGSSSSQLLELEEYLKDTNPLLANFGRIGREMIREIEQREAHIEENYSLPETVLQHEPYHSLIDHEIQWETTKRPLSLLEAVQADMVLLRNPAKDPPISFDYYDESIQVHAATSLLREVQILYNNLLSIIESQQVKGDPLQLQDIIVMAPNIMEYDSAIHAVFGRPDSQLAFQLSDIELIGNSSLIQGFAHLIQIVDSRWDAASIMQLFENPEFQRKQRLKKEDIQQIRDWIVKTEISWGENSDHRNELLKNDYCQKEMEEAFEVGTWDYGFQKLLLGLYLKLDEGDIEHFEQNWAVPERNIRTSQASLLGKWIHIFRSLREDLKPLRAGTQFTLREWANYLTCFTEAYFFIDPLDKKSSLSLQELHSVFEEFKNCYDIDSLFSWNSIKKQLDLSLKKSSLSSSSNRLDLIQFCSLLPMRTISAKVVALLGMNEESIPKLELKNPLNLMVTSKFVDYCPSQTDYDRYLFLEALLSARQYFLLSYSQSTQSEKNSPSLLVNELLDYLDRFYVIEEKKVSSLCSKIHPMFPFDKRYFSEPSFRCKSYDQDAFRAAISYYKNKAISPSTLFSLDKSWVLPNEEQILPSKYLIEATKNPIKLYTNQKLGVYLSNVEKKQIKDHEVFSLSFLDLFLLKKSAFSISYDQIINISEKSGKIPSGVFKEVAHARIKQETEEWKNNLFELGVSVKEVFKIEWSPHCKEPQREKDGSWLLPPLKVKMKNATVVKIVGSLHDLSQKGLVIYGSSGNLLKFWPQALLFYETIQQVDHPFFRSIQKEILHLKAKKRISLDKDMGNLKLWLQQYVEYTYFCLENPSPLLPEWLPTFLNSDWKSFEQLSQKNSSFFQQQNEYLSWLLGNRQHVQMNESLFSQWKQVASKTFPNIPK